MMQKWPHTQWAARFGIAVATAFCACQRQSEAPNARTNISVPIAIFSVCTSIETCIDACNKGDAESCEAWANTIAMNDAKNEHRADALKAYETACAGGKPMACVQAGRLTEFPGTVGSAPSSAPTVTPDFARAFAFYERACAQKEMTGCYNQAVLLEVGKGAPRDPAMARQLFARVCQAGGKSACERGQGQGSY